MQVMKLTSPYTHSKALPQYLRSITSEITGENEITTGGTMPGLWKIDDIFKYFCKNNFFFFSMRMLRKSA